MLEPLGPEDLKKMEIATLEAQARAIPGDELYDNLVAYRELLVLVPEDSLYTTKVNFYKEKCDQAAAIAKAVAREEKAQKARAQNEELVFDAWLTTQEVVKKRLVSPKTADFDDGWFGPQSASRCVTTVSEGLFLVRGYVDSQNGFGAMVRTNFKVLLADENDKWLLMDIEM